MKKILVVVAFGLFTDSALAWGGECKYQREIERSVDVENARALKVDAGAGSLQIEGSDQGDISIRAVLCSDDEEALAEMAVASTVGEAGVFIGTEFPRTGFLDGDTQMKIDLELSVPSSLKLDVKDSSGEALVKKVASLTMKDSSGKLEIKTIAGDVSVVDSSGELRLKNISGSVNVTDSSGGLYASNINGDFVVEADGSGEIDVRQVRQNVLIKRDGSGPIYVSGVGGDFTVQADGSGGIEYQGIAGRVNLPR